MRWREGHPPGHGVEVLENDRGHKVGILESGWGILKPVNIIDDDGCMFTGDYMHDLFEPWVGTRWPSNEKRQAKGKKGKKKLRKWLEKGATA